MNEYRGFKVGDRVEITFSSAHPIKGTITSFGDRKLGGFAEPDTMDVWISETTRYDMIYLVSHDLIKKLPKYAVGDVVRFKHKTGKNPTVVDKYGFIATIKGCDVHENICTLYEYPENYTECCFEPFDGFRVGDTVFTVKRGKGKIFAQNSHDDRQFGVRWEIDAPLYTFPKTTNLIPTEAKYKEALNKAGYAFKIDVEYVQEYVAKPYFGQIQVAPSPKFKVGDAVYHKGNKLFVKRNMISCPQMVEVGNSCAGYTTVVAESDLRIWKETVLTHCLQSDGVTWSDGGPNGWDTKWYLKIEHLPNYTNPALFKVTTKSGNECIFRGIKGDDIS